MKMNIFINKKNIDFIVKNYFIYLFWIICGFISFSLNGKKKINIFRYLIWKLKSLIFEISKKYNFMINPIEF